MRPAVDKGPGGRLSSFTLVELLVVIAIIGILTAIILSAAQSVMNSAARSRTRGEIQAISSAMEAYKVDNAIFPLTNTITGGPASYSTLDGSSVNYQEASQLLYEQLAGKTNYLDTPTAGVKVYMPFAANQLGNLKTAAGTPIGTTSTYLQDPFGYSYGYNTGDTASPQAYPPNSGSGFYDFWSTAGILQSQLAGNPALTNAWISNWTQ